LSRTITNPEVAPRAVVKKMPVRVRAWSGRKLLRSYAKIGDLSVDLEQIGKLRGLAGDGTNRRTS